MIYMNSIGNTIACYNCKKKISTLKLDDAVGIIVFIDKEGEERKCFYLDLTEVSISCSKCQSKIELDRYRKKGYIITANEELGDDWHFFNSYDLLENYVGKNSDYDIDVNYEINDKSVFASLSILEKEILLDFNLA